MKNLSIEQLKTLIVSALIMIIGILFCCSLSMGISGLSMVLGFVMIVVGVLFIVNAILLNKSLFTINGIIGTVLFTLGILFMAHNLAGIIFTFIPWFLIVLGCIIVIEAFLGKFYRNENNSIEFITKIIIGIIFLILGICLKAIPGFAEYASLILGILLIIYSIYIIFVTFNKRIDSQKN